MDVLSLGQKALSPLAAMPILRQKQSSETSRVSALVMYDKRL